MRVTTRAEYDWNGNLLKWEGYDYDGEVALAKGGQQVTAQNAKGAQTNSTAEQGNATADYNTLLPLFQQEATNPTGLGQLGLGALTTAGGEATAGALGAGKEAATLRASRAGNPSSTASIIDALGRSAMNQQSNNALKTGMENEQVKLGQQQAGLSGIENLGNESQNAALNYLGLSNTASNNLANQQQAAFSSIFGPLMQLGGATAGAVGTAVAGHP